MIPYFDIQDPLEVKAFIAELDIIDDNADAKTSIFTHNTDHGTDLFITRYRDSKRALTIKTKSTEYHFDDEGNLEKPENNDSDA